MRQSGQEEDKNKSANCI